MNANRNHPSPRIFQQDPAHSPLPSPLLSPSSTLIDILSWRAIHQKDRYAFIYLEGNGAEARTLTFGELDRQARAIAGKLYEQGARGGRALLLFPPGLEYITAFFGCLYAGVAAVPTYPPDAIRLDRTLPRFLSILKNAQLAAGLTTTPILGMIQFLAGQYPELQALPWLKTDEIGQEQAEADWRLPEVRQESLALIQFTSGSTSEPKGVMLTHANLMHNLEMIRQALDADENTRAIFWLPFYHDMGLIGGILEPVYCGATNNLMSPLHFLQHPLQWLEAIMNLHADVSGGPNFAYDLCVRKTTPEQRAALDLSGWRIAFNGAEPVRAETLERFASAFAVSGFRKEAFYPCYGLAEATLFVAGSQTSRAPNYKNVQADHLGQGRFVEAVPGETNTRTLVSSGRPMPGQVVEIVDPDVLKPCPEGQVGEVWIAGPNVAGGYWNQREASQRTFQAFLDGIQVDTYAGPYLRTGDLGFCQDGELYITGRLKDLIIVQGLNHYPQDIEASVEKSHQALRPGACAAFSVDVEGKEQVVIVAEAAPERMGKASWTGSEEIQKAVRRAVFESHELRLHEVVLIQPGTLPKTSSGKLQRYLCKQEYLSNMLKSWET
jgi:acyl-CoA synthetase (AMP-forming)/AMP-acid ligase II